MADPSGMLELTTFGGLQIRWAGRAILGEARKAQALLVYLACEPGPHSRTHLADLLWDERAPAQSQANLRQVLARMDPALSAILQITRTSLALSPGHPYRLDTAVFGDHLAGARAQRLAPGGGLAAPAVAALQQAVALYTGSFLAGFTLPDGAEFDAWMLARQQRLHYEAQAALHMLVRHYLDIGNYGVGIPFAHRLLALDPLDEAAHRALMRLHAYGGQRPAALEQYAACVQILADELGVPPGEETTALYRRIQSGVFDAPPRAGAEAVPVLTAAAAGGLLDGIAEIEMPQRGPIYEALARLHTQMAVQIPLATIEPLVRSEIEMSYHLAVIQADLEGTEIPALLTEALAGRIQAGATRLARLLEILAPEPGSPDAPAWGAPLLPPELGALVPPLLEGPPAAVLALAETHLGLARQAREDRLAELLRDPDSWLRACALFTIGVCRLIALRPLVQVARQDRDVLVRETAEETDRRLESPATEVH